MFLIIYLMVLAYVCFFSEDYGRTEVQNIYRYNLIPFKEITYDICKLEREDDDLESWQNGHRRFFREEGEKLGYTFSEDMPVIFEEFEVVYRN